MRLRNRIVMGRKKETAVEFLISEMNKLKMYVDDSEHDKVLDIIEQAKEMEKEQIMNAHKWGKMELESSEQYYNETFKS